MRNLFSCILGLAVLGFLLTAISAISTFADNPIQLSTNWGTYVWYSFLDTTGGQQGQACGGTSDASLQGNLAPRIFHFRVIVFTDKHRVHSSPSFSDKSPYRL